MRLFVKWRVRRPLNYEEAWTVVLNNSISISTGAHHPLPYAANTAACSEIKQMIRPVKQEYTMRFSS